MPCLAGRRCLLVFLAVLHRSSERVKRPRVGASDAPRRGDGNGIWDAGAAQTQASTVARAVLRRECHLVRLAHLAPIEAACHLRLTRECDGARLGWAYHAHPIVCVCGVDLAENAVRGSVRRARGTAGGVCRAGRRSRSARSLCAQWTASKCTRTCHVVNVLHLSQLELHVLPTCGATVGRHTLPVVTRVRAVRVWAVAASRRAGRRPRAAPCRRARAQHGTVRLLGCAQSGAGDRGRGAPAWASVRTSWRT